MKKAHKLELRNLLAGVLSAVMVFSSCPSTILATDEVGFEPETVLAGFEEAADDTVLLGSDYTGSDETLIAIPEENEDDLEDVSDDSSFEEDAAIVEEEGFETIEEDGIEVISEEGDAVGEDAILSEDNDDVQAEDFVEDNALMAASYDEPVRVSGKRGFFSTIFSVDLDGVTIDVSASNLYVKRGATMEVQLISADEYEETILAKNYGKVLAGKKAIQFAFYDAHNKAFTPGGLNVSFSADAILDAESYELYRVNGNSIRRIGASKNTNFNFYAPNVDTLVFAGLMNDGVLRVDGTKKNGKTVFDLDKEGVDVTVTAPKGAFYGAVSMEVWAVDENSVLDQLQDEDVVAAEAYDFSFHADSSEEIEPNKDVTVTINTENKVDDTCKIFHIKDDGEPEEVPIIDRTENSVTFLAGTFSTYALTWSEGGESKTATIHWGTLSDGLNGDFTEFDAAIIDASTAVGSASLRANYPGYVYIDAVYYAEVDENTNISVDHSSASTGRIFINDTITRVAGEGNSYTWTAEDSVNLTSFTIAAESHIYVIYQELTTPTNYPSGSQNDQVPSPTTEKKVTPNGDGTYTISLEVTGAIITQEIPNGANVIIVYDISQSMSENIGNNKTRLEASREATHALIDTLKPGTNDIQLALVTFQNTAEKRQFSSGYWTTSGTDVTNVIDGITNVGSNYGTNWHQALQFAYELAAAPPDTDDTYVIFITDGCPSSNSFSYHNTMHGALGTDNTSDPCYSGGYAFAKAIAGTKGESYSTPIYYGTQYNGQPILRETITRTGLGVKLYGIYTGSNQTSLLNTLISDSGGAQTITATTPEAISTAFKNIGQAIVNNLKPTNVTVDDGIPDLSSVSASVTGEAGGFTYSKKAKGAADSTYQTWNGAPAASYTEENGVVWDLSKAEEGSLDANTTYRLQFTVWPSQDAYDLLADLNNGIKSLPLYKEDGVTVDDDAMSQLVIKIGSNRYVYTPGQTAGSGTWTDGLTTELLVARINEAEEEEETVTYSIPTNTHLNTTYLFNGVVYSDTPSGVLPSEDMLLKDTTISVEKIWHNYLDSRTDDDIDGLQMVLSKDGADYLEFDVSEDNDWKAENIFISCGVIASGVIKEKGHDYYVTENAASANNDKTPYWEVDSPVYHPMVIDGTLKMLIKVDNASDANYTIDSKYYKLDESQSTLSATNERVSWLNLKKALTTGINPDDDFKFTVNIVEKDNQDIYFSVRGGGMKYRDDIVCTNIVGTYVDNSDPDDIKTYYIAHSGENFTLELKPDWNARFLNLSTGSSFTIQETGMEDYYEFDSATLVEKWFIDENGHMPEDYPITTSFSDNNIKGTINQTNSDYTVTVTNKPLEFYIFHSGAEVNDNNRVETIPFDQVNSNGTYNLYAHTLPGTLYGGYYKEYAGKGNYNGDGVNTEEGDKYSGINFVWDKTKAYTDNAETNMKPTAGTTYYIKEVPIAYLQNYIHYIIVEEGTHKGLIKGWYLISAIDDLNYDETGFYLTMNNTEEQKTCLKQGQEEAERVKVVSKITFVNSETGQSSENDIITPFKCFNTDKNGHTRVYPILDGGENGNDRLTYYKAFNTKYCAESAEYTMLPYWVTPDGIEVKGKSTRTVKFGTTLYLDKVTITESIGSIFTTSTEEEGE